MTTHPEPIPAGTAVYVEFTVVEGPTEHDYYRLKRTGHSGSATSFVPTALVHPLPAAADVDDEHLWPSHWTFDAVLEREHARFHDQDGNLLGRDGCEEMRCDFWDAAQHLLHAGLVVRRAGDAA